MTAITNNLAWVRAIQQTSLDQTTKHVLVTIGLHGNPAMEAWPSQALLAKETSFSVGTVNRAVKRAVELGWLTVYKCKLTIASQHVSNLYELHTPRASQSESPETTVAPGASIYLRLTTESLAPDASRTTRNLQGNNKERENQDSLSGVTLDFGVDSQAKPAPKKRTKAENDLDRAFDQFWSLWPRRKVERALVEKRFHACAKAIGPTALDGAAVLLKQVAKYAENFERSSLNPHHPLKRLAAGGQVPTPNDRKGGATTFDPKDFH